MEFGNAPGNNQHFRIRLKTMTILVAGGVGFIGANFVLDWLATCDQPVLNLGKLRQLLGMKIVK